MATLSVLAQHKSRISCRYYKKNYPANIHSSKQKTRSSPYKIASEYNEFRETQTITMANNYVSTTDAHLLEIDLYSSNRFIYLCTFFYSNEKINFLKDSHLILKLVNADAMTETLLLKPKKNNNTSVKQKNNSVRTSNNNLNINITPSTTNQNVYASYWIYPITEVILCKLSNALKINYSFETTKMPFTGEFPSTSIARFSDFKLIFDNKNQTTETSQSEREEAPLLPKE